jgi:hypothetical protein
MSFCEEEEKEEDEEEENEENEDVSINLFSNAICFASLPK